MFEMCIKVLVYFWFTLHYNVIFTFLFLFVGESCQLTAAPKCRNEY